MPTTDGSGDIMIAYASQTGTGELKARNAALALARGGVKAEVLTIGKLTPELLAATRHILFVVSTYGDGEPPDMARGFTGRVMRGDPLDLGHLQYGLLALGDHEYPDFCGYGRKVDGWLGRMGAKAMFPYIRMDHRDAEAESAWQAVLHDLGASEGTRGQTLIPFEEWTLVAREELNPGSAHLKAFHLRFEPPADGDAAWEAGDIVEIQPQNAPELVDALLAAQATEGDILEVGALLRETLATAILPERGGAITTEGLRLLPPREYSAASITADGTIDLVVRQVRAEDGGFGIGSGWLTAHMPMGSRMAMRVRPNPGFRVEAQGNPLILIGNGTGIAGLRAHLRTQAHDGAKGHWLLFGERSRAHEAFFDSELQHWQADGTLARLDRAYSRDADCGRYVQQLLLDAEDELTGWIDRGAIILVCGSLEGMAQAVHAALATILGETRLDQLAEQDRYKRDVY